MSVTCCQQTSGRFYFYDNSFSLSTVCVVLDDNRDNSDNGKNGRNGLCHEVTYNKDNGDYSAPDASSYDNAWDFKDNRDNRNNRKNRRNRGCHEVTYNKDNGDYSVPDVSFYDNGDTSCA